MMHGQKNIKKWSVSGW